MGFFEISSLVPTVSSSTLAWLSLAFLLGLVHAFDADHVMALSVFASSERGAREGIRVALRWAVGHGVIVLGFGIALLFLGKSLPASMRVPSERLVGVVMIVLGGTVCTDLLRRRSHLHFHLHDDLLPHAHWHSHENAGHRHQHGAVMLGAVHGLAGSAPILAVLPAAARSPALGVAYLALFVVGVALAMALVSGIIGHFAGELSKRAQIRGLSMLRASCASGSIALGLWLLMVASPS